MNNFIECIVARVTTNVRPRPLVRRIRLHPEHHEGVGAQELAAPEAGAAAAPHRLVQEALVMDEEESCVDETEG